MSHAKTDQRRKHHPYDLAVRDIWRNSPADVVEGVLGRPPLPAGAMPEQTQLVQRELIADGLVTDAEGAKIHVEFQTRRDPTIGWRMARYWTALVARATAPPPKQHLVLLHSSANQHGLGTYKHGSLTLMYRVIKLWEIDPEGLLSRPTLAPFVTLAKAPDEARPVLMARAIRAISTRLPPDQALRALDATTGLASLYLSRNVLEDVLKRSDMPIDINDLPLFAEARDEGLREGQRDAVSRVLTNRFGDQAPTERVSTRPDALLLEAIDRATTGTAEEFTAWLDELQH